MAGGFNRDHDHYVMKNRMLAGAEQLDRKSRRRADGKTEVSERKKACFNCKLKRGCRDFRAKRSGGADGVVSFGGSQDSMVCDRYEPETEKRGMDNKQIRSLMRGFKRSQ